ncbi:uncharacterized protein LOC126833800 [Adelges cooleyi]|uniref:uncharacterized protein LOC126833800 n=1 Tax=Adelges cooleyi TaxID=133065 RepID=UPI0021807BF6|nr:uncharacterized protein LOC126833800 [Adelges cooleyi]
MKVLYVLLCCAFLNVIAHIDYEFVEESEMIAQIEREAELNARKRLETTNILIREHIDRNTIVGKIIEVVENEVLMEKLTFMFALPEQDYQQDCHLQDLMELNLQLVMVEGSGLTKVRAEALGNSTVLVVQKVSMLLELSEELC